MKRFRLVMIPLALVAAAGSAGAQRWGGSPAPSGPARLERGAEAGRRRDVERHGLQVGRVSGSGHRCPALSPGARDSAGCLLPGRGRRAGAVVAYVVDTVYTVYTAVPANAVEMKAVTSRRPEPELTAMDVYRQQRFRNP